jgi:hypothetical protein
MQAENESRKSDSASNALFDVHPMEMGATFSDCRTYRWTLWRKWDDDLPPCVFIGLNPSTADEMEDDPTIRRCIGFAKSWGLGGLVMLNAFAFRASDPKVMMAADDPVGEANNRTIALTTYSASLNKGRIIAAWGSHCPDDRQREVCRQVNSELFCLGRTKAGKPKHPLYLRADTQPEVFWSPSP